MVLKTFDPASGSAETEAAALLRNQQRAFAGDMLPSRATRDDRLRRLAELLETHAQSLHCRGLRRPLAG